MLHDDALGPSGRAGGVAEVGDVVRAWGPAGRRGAVHKVGRGEHTDARQRLHRNPPPKEQTDPGVLDDVGDAGRRVAGVERHEGVPRHHDAQQYDDGLGAAVETDADTRPVGQAEPTDPLRNVLRAVDEIGVAQLVGAVDQRGLAALLDRPAPHGVGERLRSRIGQARRAQQRHLLLRAEQTDPADLDLRSPARDG